LGAEHRRLGVRAGAAAALLTIAAPARAQVPDAAPIVALDMEGCAAIPPAAVRRALEVEAGVRLQDPPAAAPLPAPAAATAATSTLVVRCDADRALLAVQTTAGGRLERQLALDQLAGDTAPRLVALAALELLASLDPALRRKLAAADVAITAPPAPAPPPTPRRTTVGVGAVHRSFSAPSGAGAWGGQLAVARAIGRRLGVAGGLELAVARRPTPLGDATALLASGSIAAGWRAGGERVGVRFESGARGGVARLSGAANNPDVAAVTVVRPWAGPFAAAHVLVGRNAVCVDLGVEAGAAVVAATGLANDTPAVEVRGAWLALSLSLALRL
jgi:hypothetical protein